MKSWADQIRTAYGETSLIGGVSAGARALRRQAGAQILSQAGFSGLSFVWAVAVARLFGVEGKGEVSGLTLLSSTIAAFAILGTGDAILFFVGRHGEEIASKLLRTCIIHSGAVILIGCLVGYVTSLMGFVAFSKISVALLVAAGGLAGLMVFNRQQQLFLIASGRALGAGVAPCVQVGVSICGLVFLWVFRALSVQGAFWVYFASHSVAAVTARLQIGRLMHAKTRGAPKGYWTFSGNTVPGTIAKYLNYRLDQTAIGALLGAGPLGLYGAAVNIAEVGTYVTNAVALTVMPMVARPGQSRKVAVSALALAVTAALAAMLVLALAGPFVLAHVFGPAFANGSRLLFILLPGALFSGIATVAASIASGLGRPIVGSLAAGIGLLVTLVGLWYALPKYGLDGAAWVSTGAYAVTCAASLLGLLSVVRRQ